MEKHPQTGNYEPGHKLLELIRPITKKILQDKLIDASKGIKLPINTYK